MYLIVGLGNPSATYKRTRHNVGFIVLDAFREHVEAPAFRTQKKFEGLVSKSKKPEAILLKPQTFMNNSGRSVAKIMRWYTIPTDHLIVVHDELDLPFGRIRISRSSSSGGHNGVASIIETLGTKDFIRLRVGIAGEHKNHVSGEQYVLQQFTKHEMESLPTSDSLEALLACIQKNPEAAMQRFNVKK